MQSFVVVGKTHTLPEDAESLDMPMSKVSRAMPSMETAARIHLFCREGGAVHLTDAGRDYLGASERALAAYGEASNVPTAHRESAEGVLRVGVPILFARRVLAPLLPSFSALYPGVHIEMFLYISPWDPHTSAPLDILLKVGGHHDTRFGNRVFPPIRLGIHAAPTYLAQNPEIRVPKDLLSHRCIGFSTGHDLFAWRGSYRGERIALNPEFDTFTGDAEIQTLLAQLGMGIALLPLWLAHSSVERGTLARVLPDFELDSLVFNALHVGNARTDAKENAFLAFLEGVLGTDEDPRTQGRSPSEFFLTN